MEATDIVPCPVCISTKRLVSNLAIACECCGYIFKTAKETRPNESH